MNKTLSELIEQYEQDGDFTYVAPTPEMLESAQELLGITIPQQFVDYLTAYGHGGKTIQSMQPSVRSYKQASCSIQFDRMYSDVFGPH